MSRPLAVRRGYIASFAYYSSNPSETIFDCATTMRQVPGISGHKIVGSTILWRACRYIYIYSFPTYTKLLGENLCCLRTLALQFHLYWVRNFFMTALAVLFNVSVIVMMFLRTAGDFLLSESVASIDDTMRVAQGSSFVAVKLNEVFSSNYALVHYTRM